MRDGSVHRARPFSIFDHARSVDDSATFFMSRSMHATPELPRPADLLVVGHVTRDLVAGEERLGGAASYAALAAASRGLIVELVTVGPSHWTLLAPILTHPNIRATVLPADVPTTFRLVYESGARSVFRHALAPSIDVPGTTCPVVYLAPVAGEIAPDAALRFGRDAFVVAGLQGWMRAVDEAGRVRAIDPPQLHGIHAAILSEHDHPRADALAAELARGIAVVVVTRGARGATVYADRRSVDVPAFPANEVDPTGAGDVFGVVLALGLATGKSPVDAATEAAFVAARSVEHVGVGS